MRSAAESVRGTALVETAVTLSFTLLLLFGALQMALIGYFQLQLDGATFFFTHEYASGSTNVNNLNTALGPLFPNVPLAITPIPYQPPDTTVEPNFTQWGTLNNRFGGASLLRPQRLQAKATMKITASAFGGSVNLSAGNVDARPVISNHDDDASGDDYNSTQAYTSVVDPLNTDDQNVPPYYITLAFIWNCNMGKKGWSNCPGRQLRSLGLAEYLKDDNYSSTDTGIDNQTSAFYYMKCHQRAFAGFSSEVALALNYTVAEATLEPNIAQGSDAYINQIYSWDYMPIHGEPANNPHLGQLFPLSPGNGC
ncbi:MAG TPA: hypothetical protein VKT72_14030 [Candidatus Baltobacteraceae bacterium]|nr:hypothetical protein [Candidatus Baltobacteraceae bacterium]